MNREEILKVAEELVNGARAKSYGSPQENFSRLAGMISAYLDADVNDYDIPVILTMLKMSRIRVSPDDTDNWIDGCGYMSLGGEITTEVKQEFTTVAMTEDCGITMDCHADAE